jgi:tRNA uridine 5-carbamoylmethylation protein Kti12
MDDFSGGMRNLSEDILTGHKDRKYRIQELKDRTDAIKKNTAQFLDETRRLHAEMGKDLKKDLKENRDNLLKDVNAMRDDFRKNEKEVRADLAEAKNIWNDMKNILGGKSA